MGDLQKGCSPLNLFLLLSEHLFDIAAHYAAQTGGAIETDAHFAAACSISLILFPRHGEFMFPKYDAVFPTKTRSPDSPTTKTCRGYQKCRLNVFKFSKLVTIKSQEIRNFLIKKLFKQSFNQTT